MKDSSEQLPEKFDQLSALQDELTTTVEEIQSQVQQKETELRELQGELEREKETVKGKLEQLVQTQNVDDELLDAFVDKPYTIVPRGENESWVIVPRWVPFNVGYLERQDESYNHFVVNKYVNWITELPDEIQQSVGINSTFDDVTVDNGVATFSSETERDKAWEVLGGRDGGLYQRKGDTQIKLKSGKEFEVIAQIIEEGNLPFSSRPIEEADLRSEPANVSLRSYQKRAWEKFLETGMVGVYWPPGCGKTFLSLYAGERIRGRKLVVVPQKTLQEQWNQRIQEFCERPEEWDVKTYQYLTYGDNMEEYNDGKTALTIFDESHKIPATTYSKIATINTKYRMGLTASPYREEDGTTKYIFALTGYPVGLNWDEFVELGVTEYPDVRVYLHRTERQKQQTVEELVTEPGKTVVFCDGIDAGKTLSSQLDVPFVYGETENRLEVFDENRVVITSRVGDEGLSLSDIDRVVEYQFHGGSRRQELQRAGRVMHNDDDSNGEHIVLMTDEEHDKFSRRLFSLEEKGFNINYIRRP